VAETAEDMTNQGDIISQGDMINQWGMVADLDGIKAVVGMGTKKEVIPHKDIKEDLNTGDILLWGMDKAITDNNHIAPNSKATVMDKLTTGLLYLQMLMAVTGCLHNRRYLLLAATIITHKLPMGNLCQEEYKEVIQ